jgi:hypothetical protein
VAGDDEVVMKAGGVFAGFLEPSRAIEIGPATRTTCPFPYLADWMQPARSMPKSNGFEQAIPTAPCPQGKFLWARPG